jgi:hypothetical protein
MPSNIENANISAIKLGTADVTKGYIGHEEVYPNTRQITSAAFTNTSTLSSSGGTRTYRVGGAIGSQYSLTGSNGASSPGVQTLSSSPTDYSVSVGANSACGTSNRTPTITISPTGSTALGSGVSSTSSFTQSGTGSGTAYSMSMSASIQDLSKVTTTVGGVVYYAPGSTWTINVSWTIPSAINWGTTYYQYLSVSKDFTSYAGSNPGIYVFNSTGWANTSAFHIYDSTGNQFPADRISTGNQQSGTSSFTVEYRTAGGGYQPQYAGGVRLRMYGPTNWGGPACSTLNGSSVGNSPYFGATSYLYP